MSEKDKKGYLREDFRLFRLKDQKGGGGNLHYHDFDKIVFFISGRVNYMVDGVTYPLAGGDVLLVRRFALHRADIDVSEPYERVIIYIGTDFAERCSTEDTRLLMCFDDTQRSGKCLIRGGKGSRGLWESLSRLESAAASNDYGADVLARAEIVRLLVLICRMGKGRPENPNVDDKSLKRIEETLRYISENPAEDLSVASLASRCFYSRYHFMRLFREVTGMTVHNYVREKRLMRAARLLIRGTSSAEAAALSGFGDYSAFQRAFKEEFGVSPSKFRETGLSELPERE
ncbi:MAG: helix-turn-helix domain-containing protein [Oscillospiraceae bacterium]|nr:helix-turn-helix domain-containing protein [Oscillospiraceae bacterium]